MKVSDWLDRYPERGVTVAPHAELDEAAKAMLDRPECRALYVVDSKGKVVGHLGFRRLAGLLLAEHRPRHTRRELVERVTHGPVSAYMDDRFVFASPDEYLDNVLHRHMERQVEDMPVVDAQGELQGVIRLADVLRAIIEDPDMLGG